MARKKPHEEHTNHEAWAIPYADLMTLLLAFFVVMYAISSLNEGKYKIMAEALNSAFGGPPRAPNLIQFQSPPSTALPPAPIKPGTPDTGTDMLATAASHLRSFPSIQATVLKHSQQQLNTLADEIEHSLGDLIRENLITVRRSELWLEVEINSDILFATGSAVLEADARKILQKVAAALECTTNQIRIEGYTDNRPISTAQFPSNWELSSARAASVVHLFSKHRIVPERLSMVGFGEYRPLAENSTSTGQGRNRRVILVVLAASPGAAPSPQYLAHNRPGVKLAPTASEKAKAAAEVTASNRPSKSPPTPSYAAIWGNGL